MAYTPVVEERHVEAARLYLKSGSETCGDWPLSCFQAGFAQAPRIGSQACQIALRQTHTKWEAIVAASSDGAEQKKCSRCKSTKLLRDFPRNRANGKLAKGSWCRECSRAYQRARCKAIRAGTWDRWNHKMARRMDRTPKASRHPSMKDLYWAAGFLEGEGSFTVYSTHLVRANQKEREPLEKLQELFGGRIYETKEIPVWVVGGQRAYGVMLTLFALLSERRRKQIITATGNRGRLQGGVS